MNCNHDLDRDELEFPDGEEGRIYYCTKPSCNEVIPSVTTITGRKDDPGKKRALKYWRINNDGEDGNADWECLQPYTQWRGTLAHFNTLYHLDSSLESSSEETKSLKAVKERSTDYKWVHSVLKNRAKYRNNITQFDEQFPTEQQYDGRTHRTLRDVLAEDVSFATRAFYNNVDELGLANVSYEDSDCVFVSEYVDEHVRTENVIGVEKYIPTDKGYSGQLDLIYQKPDGTKVLCDLKTSSGVRWSHRCQSCAYANALQTDVDDMVIARFHPDSTEVELEWESGFGTSRREYMKQFNGLKGHVVKLVNQMDVMSDDSEKAVA